MLLLIIAMLLAHWRGKLWLILTKGITSRAWWTHFPSMRNMIASKLFFEDSLILFIYFPFLIDGGEGNKSTLIWILFIVVAVFFVFRYNHIHFIPKFRILHRLNEIKVILLLFLNISLIKWNYKNSRWIMKVCRAIQKFRVAH